MVLPTRFLRRFGIFVVASALALAHPLGTLAGFGTSPGSPRVAACASGTHYPDATLTTRKAGKGQQEYL
jgi:hypothetical protein